MNPDLVFFLPAEFSSSAYVNPKKKERERVPCEFCKRVYQITRQQMSRRAKNFPQSLTCSNSCSSNLRTARRKAIELDLEIKKNLATRASDKIRYDESKANARSLV